MMTSPMYPYGPSTATISVYSGEGINGTLFGSATMSQGASSKMKSMREECFDDIKELCSLILS